MTYNFYTITVDIQITVLGRLFITICIIWSDNHYSNNIIEYVVACGKQFPDTNVGV